MGRLEHVGHTERKDEVVKVKLFGIPEGGLCCPILSPL